MMFQFCNILHVLSVGSFNLFWVFGKTHHHSRSNRYMKIGENAPMMFQFCNILHVLSVGSFNLFWVFGKTHHHSRSNRYMKIGENAPELFQFFNTFLRGGGGVEHAPGLS